MTALGWLSHVSVGDQVLLAASNSRTFVVTVTRQTHAYVVIGTGKDEALFSKRTGRRRLTKEERFYVREGWFHPHVQPYDAKSAHRIATSEARGHLLQDLNALVRFHVEHLSIEQCQEVLMVVERTIMVMRGMHV